MPTLLLPIAQSSASSDAWTGSGRVSSFVRSHVFCLLLHGVETNTRGTVSTNYCRAGFDANITRLENSFPFHFGWLARYCIRRVAVAVRQVCAHSTFSPQEPNRLACSGAIFFFMLAMLGGTYQLPLFYQAVSCPDFT